MVFRMRLLDSFDVQEGPRRHPKDEENGVGGQVGIKSSFQVHLGHNKVIFGEGFGDRIGYLFRFVFGVRFLCVLCVFALVFCLFCVWI